MSKNRDQMIIQKLSRDKFSAQELWYMGSTRSFWAWEKDDNKVNVTLGNLSENDGKTIVKIGKTIYECGEDVDNFVEKLVEQKTKEGYECFAIELLG